MNTWSTRTKDEINRSILQEIRAGALESEAGMGDWRLNDLQRDMIAAYRAEHGEAWLGNINLYKDTYKSGDPVIWRWDGGLVCNFGARFVLPRYDAHLAALILERHSAQYTGTAADSILVEEIHRCILELGGEPLIWN